MTASDVENPMLLAPGMIRMTGILHLQTTFKKQQLLCFKKKVIVPTFNIRTIRKQSHTRDLVAYVTSRAIVLQEETNIWSSYIQSIPNYPSWFWCKSWIWRCSLTRYTVQQKWLIPCSVSNGMHPSYSWVFFIKKKYITFCKIHRGQTDELYSCQEEMAQ